MLNLVIISFFTYLFPFILFFSWNRLKRSKFNPSPNLAQKKSQEVFPKKLFLFWRGKKKFLFFEFVAFETDRPTYRHLNRRWVDKAAVGLQRSVAARSPQNFKAPVRRLSLFHHFLEVSWKQKFKTWDFLLCVLLVFMFTTIIENKYIKLEIF